MRPLFIMLALVGLFAGGVVAKRLAEPPSADLSYATLIETRPGSVELARRGVWYAQRPGAPALCYATWPSIEPGQNPTCATCHDGDALAPLTGAPPQRNLFLDWSDAPRDGLATYTQADNAAPLQDWLDRRGWTGYAPDFDGLDLHRAAFDSRGHARDGSGWVAFRFQPHPSSWPSATGAWTDVAIRLPAPFRSRSDGVPSDDVYAANLAILEAAIRNVDRVETHPIDERPLGVDLDGDGALLVALSVVARGTFVGGAEDQNTRPDAFPVGVEFLQMLRYFDVTDGAVGPARRLKEVRHLQKTSPLNPAHWADARAARRAPSAVGAAQIALVAVESGVETGSGWTVQGFIEDAAGALRPQTAEELASCVGCHGGLPASVDSVFSFPRKHPGADGWSLQNAAAFAPDGFTDILQREMVDWLDATGGDPLGNDQTAAFPDATLLPDPARAEALNAAYRAMVGEQSFLFGRTPRLAPPARLTPDDG